ncbi:DUF485 domain-containing protein [Pseudogracilibacillus sp. SO30301A]|uniref:DUF485 domain-containing protein n=1 Tax=Pseudogracilibacillus sp. SO30301A TaxID=3098291 RepID=UPI00300E68D7
MDTIKRWKQEKRLFVVWISVLAVIFYLSLPLSLAFIPDKMNKPSLFGLSWAWIYAFLQVLMTWLIGWIYWVKAKQLDQLVERMRQEEAE